MSQPTNHWKLGLFVVAAMVVAIAGVMYFGSRNLPKDTSVTYVSYFDEAVTGLEYGAAVKFRGVTVGNVSKIEVAPDRRHVQVSYDIARNSSRILALEQQGAEKSVIGSALRAQLGSQGVTGVKYISLDLFEGEPPVESLPFQVPRYYIPATPSTMQKLEDAVSTTAHRLPEVVDQMVAILGRVDALLATVQGQKLPQHASNTLTHFDQAVATLHTKIEQFDSAGLSAQGHATLGQLQETVGRVNGILDRVEGKAGVLANAERASLSMGDAARNASRVGGQAERTLREVGDAAAAIRELADLLERQPDMLLK